MTSFSGRWNGHVFLNPTGIAASSTTVGQLLLKGYGLPGLEASYEIQYR